MKIAPGQNSSFSALRAYSKSTAATAHNLANLNTEKFVPLKRHFVEQDGGVKLTLSRESPEPGASMSRPQSIGNSMVELVGDGHAYKANLNALKTQLDLDDVLLGMAAGSRDQDEGNGN